MIRKINRFKIWYRFIDPLNTKAMNCKRYCYVIQSGSEEEALAIMKQDLKHYQHQLLITGIEKCINKTYHPKSTSNAKQ